MNPYFSVILPIYNVELYLERCVRSILEQDFSDYELILVNDGSKDASGQICDRLAAQYEHIRVVHKENGGLSSARNAGTEVARGEYVWWVDSDDWVDLGALSVLHDATCQTKPDVVKFDHIRAAREQIPVVTNAAAGMYQERRDLDKLIGQAFYTPSKYVLSAWSHIYKREFLEKNHLAFVSERLIVSEDYLFTLQTLLHASKILVLKKCLYFYEERMGSLSQQYKKDAPKKYTELYRQLREYYCQMGALERYGKMIDTFYVWHLMRGACIVNEYYVSQNHTLAEGRKNIRTLFGMEEFQIAVRNVDWASMPMKKKIQVMAMRMGCEPLFYWLYVKKPQLVGKK